MTVSNESALNYFFQAFHDINIAGGTFDSCCKLELLENGFHWWIRWEKQAEEDEAVENNAKNGLSCRFKNESDMLDVRRFTVIAKFFT